MREARPDDVGVSVSYPLPGTKFYELVKEQLGDKRHWQESNDLEMMFAGTYTSDFYRGVRNLLHDEVAHPGSPHCRRAGTNSSTAKRNTARTRATAIAAGRRDELRRMPDILLTHGYFLAEDEKERQIMKPYPPLGLLYLSAFLKRAGFSVEVFDSTFGELAALASGSRRRPAAWSASTPTS